MSGGAILPLASAVAGYCAGCDDMATSRNRRIIPRGRARGIARRHGGIWEPEAERRPLTLALLQRGQERFRIYCAPCHSELGDGRGMVVQRGFPPPPSYHIDRLRNAPPQYFYDVITEGHGVMYSFADRVTAGGSLGDCGVHPRTATEPKHLPCGRAGRLSGPASAMKLARAERRYVAGGLLGHV